MTFPTRNEVELAHVLASVVVALETITNELINEADKGEWQKELCPHLVAELQVPQTNESVVSTFYKSYTSFNSQFGTV